MKSSIAGHFGTYQEAYNAVGRRFLKSRNFSIQCNTDYRMYPYVLIYYGNFV